MTAVRIRNLHTGYVKELPTRGFVNRAVSRSPRGRPGRLHQGRSLVDDDNLGRSSQSVMLSTRCSVRRSAPPAALEAENFMTEHPPAPVSQAGHCSELECRQYDPDRSKEG